jgi:putative ABC transport system substrate-binding protein
LTSASLPPHHRLAAMGARKKASPKRRCAGLGILVVGVALSSLVATAQPAPKTFRLGYLTGPGSLHTGFAIAFREFSLRELGWIEGTNLVVERRAAGDRPALLKEFAAELVQRRVDVIVAEGLVAARAAKEATRTTPIVFAVSGDPVAAGLVASLARPGANATGMTTLSADLAGKRLQLIAEVVPTAKRIGVLWNAANPEVEDEWRQTQAAAGQAGITITPLAVRSGPEVVPAVDSAIRQRVGGVVVLADPLTLAYGHDIIERLNGRRIPAIYGARWFLSGEATRQPGGVSGLISFAPALIDLATTVASYVDRILKGARPADLPVQQPVSFELVVNLKAAKALRLTVPQSLLLRADQVLE